MAISGETIKIMAFAFVDDTTSTTEMAKTVDQQAWEIIEDAQNIYQRTPSLQKSVTGQAEALLLAAEKAKSAPKSTKVVDKDAKRAINKLKKKTSLDGKVLKSDMSKRNVQQLKKKARAGDDSHKLDFAIQSGMLGDISNLVDAI